MSFYRITPPRAPHRELLVAVCVAVCVSWSAQAVQPADGLDWRRIGAPGNRPANEVEAPGLRGLPVGQVDYRYRLTRTEITVGQWFEFVEAHAPFWQGSRTDEAFTSIWISPSNSDPNQPPDYRITPGAENFPANMSWRVAARYANWLHNGKVNEAWAFEDGAYDTSTFTSNPDGTLNDQLERHPDAKYWIPNWDEWVKGAYFDPNRYGPGSEGYWLYPDGGQDILIPGLPGDAGAETSAAYGTFVDAGSYPHAESPWGLLDLSGGLEEWLETVNDPMFPSARELIGSHYFDISFALHDRLDTTNGANSPDSHFGNGLRLGSVVPSPVATLVLLTVPLARSRRR